MSDIVTFTTEELREIRRVFAELKVAQAEVVRLSAENDRMKYHLTMAGVDLGDYDEGWHASDGQRG